jgi:transcriptional regulator with GAF, ATPase, and Fis domain
MVRRVLSDPADLEDAMKVVLEAAVDATGAARGLLAVFGADGVPALVSPRGDPDPAVSRAVLEAVAQGRAPVRVDDARGDPRFRSSASVARLDLRTVLAVPLLLHGRALGALYLEGRKGGAFDGADEALLTAFAEQVAPHMEALRVLHERTAELARLRRAYQEDVAPRYRDIVGRSPAVRRAIEIIDRVAPTPVPVLIQGESGTGKELLARALHFGGPRRDRPFVAVNCAALPETLLESELFGHARGAFTGAVAARTGLFEEANGGTLFLDEIGDTSPALQAKLLRVLQNGEVRPIGSSDVRRVDVRLVSASLRRLADLVAEGVFREDLYYRVNAVVVELPPLRERREDIPLLAAHLIARIAREAGQPPPRLGRRATALLLAQPWPGNVRQVENVLRAAMALAPGPALDDDTLREVLGAAAAGPDARAGTAAAAPGARGQLRDALDQSQLAHTHAALEESGWNVAAAARRLGVSRQALYRIMRRHRLDRGV